MHFGVKICCFSSFWVKIGHFSSFSAFLRPFSIIFDHFSTISATFQKTTFYSIKRLLKRLNTAPREIVLYTDFHGHNRKNNIFIYGCTPTEQHRKETKPMPKQSKQERFSEKVFPYLLQQKCPELFSFNDCKFNIQKSKEGTGRIVAWRSGIVNAYTIEASFCGTKGTSRKDTHLSITDLENMGKKFCEALHEFSKEDTYRVVLREKHENGQK